MQALATSSTSTEELPLDYKPCGCLGIIAPLSNRGCHRCFSSHWLKRCVDCLGLGTLTKALRQTNSHPRVERCGRCMGTGWVPCPLREVQQAEASTREPEVVEVPEFVEPTIETPAHRTSARKQKLAESKQRRKPGPQPGFKKRREEEARAKSQPSLAPEAVEPHIPTSEEENGEGVEVPAGSFTGDLTGDLT
jgi:hypothetical protein